MHVDRFTIISVSLAFFISLFCSSLLFRTIAAISIEPNPSIPDISIYHPKIEYVGRDPLHTINDLPSHPNSDVPVFAKVIDKYGKIQQVVLSYRIVQPFTEQENSPRKNITMKLINGIPSNGTYSAFIPEQKDNTLVHYQIYLKDDLNYTLSYPGEDYWVADHKIVHVSVGPLESQKPVNFTAEVTDYDDKIKNVTLSYAVTSVVECPGDEFGMSQCIPSKFSSVEMKFYRPSDYYGSYYKTESAYESGIPKVATTYKASVPPVPENRTIWYFVNSTDYGGNRDSYRIHDMPVRYEIVNPKFRQEEMNHRGLVLNNLRITTKVLNVDLDSRTANMEIHFEGNSINPAFINSKVGALLKSNIRHGYNNIPVEGIKGKLVSDEDNNSIPVEGVDLVSNGVKDLFPLTMKGFVEPSSFVDFATANESGYDSHSFSLTGDPAAFPFDHYSVNLLLEFPFKVARPTYDHKFDKLINSSWVPASNLYSLNTDKIEILYSNLDCSIPINNESFICGLRNPKASHDLVVEDVNHATFLKIDTDFERNSPLVTSTIILPIVSIFFLIGTIFILRPKGDFLAIRVTMALGIFAFLFTFTPIINQMKAPAIANVPTIADFFITLILTATIGSTMSSVIGNLLITEWTKKDEKKKIRELNEKNGTEQKKKEEAERPVGWIGRSIISIDGAVILLASAAIIWYFWFPNFWFPSNSLVITLRILLTIIPIVGLSYGLLLRIFGTLLRNYLSKMVKKVTIFKQKPDEKFT